MNNIQATPAAAPQKYEKCWKEEGFVIVPSLLSPQECAELKRESLRILEKHAGPGATVYVGCAAVSPAFNELAGHPEILRVLEQIMPEGIEFLSDKLVYKTAAKSFATPYHIDASYWKNTRPKLSVWIPFDDVSGENGTLTVIPGSHLREWKHHLGTGINKEFTTSIQDADIPVDQVVTCTIARGTAVIFSDRLVHGSTSANGKSERYAIISTYHAPGEEPFDLEFPARKVLKY